ncbi:MAG: bifunctional riboflavin kinase/FAD synthetase [Dehalococcoidia bacterium]|nr:bifunctional riboflavin kinase/FAD synthetase [Dehalococcoidia bacterium]MDW8120167.1 bifunctional riboflavin kinase/FAD synthetase [Chloroflexota bacterium]
MRWQEELASARKIGPSAVSIGVFDGVHLGHQHLLSTLCAEARSRGLHSVVVTFRNHPRLFLNPHHPFPLLTTADERVALLEHQGVEAVLPLTFDAHLARVSAEEFLRALVEQVRMRLLVAGPDFALGYHRQGTLPVVQALGQRLDFSVVVVSPYLLHGRVVSSSAIRQAILEGQVAEAGRMLGRPFALVGIVRPGAGRGRRLGFPTANLAVDSSMAIPANGIYATWAVWGGRRWPSATSIGVRPTFGGGERTIETYILDFQGDLYGQRLRLEFVHRLRDEQAFPTVQALVEQMTRDIATVRALLSTPSPV